MSQWNPHHQYGCIWNKEDIKIKSSCKDEILDYAFITHTRLCLLSFSMHARKCCLWIYQEGALLKDRRRNLIVNQPWLELDFKLPKLWKIWFSLSKPPSILLWATQVNQDTNYAVSTQPTSNDLISDKHSKSQFQNTWTFILHGFKLRGSRNPPWVLQFLRRIHRTPGNAWICWFIVKDTGQGQPNGRYV